MKKRKTRPGSTKKKKRVSGSTESLKIAGNTFKKAGCSKLKSGAKRLAESARASGKNARVVKSGTGYCVYTRSRTARKAA